MRKFFTSLDNHYFSSFIRALWISFIVVLYIYCIYVKHISGGDFSIIFIENELLSEVPFVHIIHMHV